MAERTCIVTRQVMEPGSLIRFVAAPDGTVVPDLRGKLPGRGVWVSAKHALVAQAVQKRAFARGLKAQVKAPDDLADQVDALLVDQVLGALGFARKAGDCFTGAGKVEAAIRGGRAIAVLHATDGAEDGLRKLEQAVRQSESADGRPLKVWRCLTNAQMNLSLGATHVIHACITNGSAGRNCVSRLAALNDYREMEPS